jgi:hypothetical protein
MILSPMNSTNENADTSHACSPTVSHDSVVTFALPFVTLTPSCFALWMMSTRLREETECEISAANTRLSEVLLVLIPAPVDRSYA